MVLGRVPRLAFSPVGQSLLSEIPRVASPKSKSGRDETEADNPVPRYVSSLVVHIIDTHVDHLEDVVSILEIELGSIKVGPSLLSEIPRVASPKSKSGRDETVDMVAL
nr:Mg2+ transporter protein, CorA-like/zinc transport protein ZntB [Tanacetum cinerariifolium]